MMTRLPTIIVDVVVCLLSVTVSSAQSPAWGSWGSWTCSVTCGRGTESRTRTCTPPGSTCPGVASETRVCERPACCVPTHGQWNNWGRWSSCSRSCGGGTQTRSRTCYGRNDCGRPCEGEDSEYQDCNVEECATWGEWVSWTCSVTCGRGTESRTRTCTPPGARCAGPSTDIQECQRPACCVPTHGQWNNWSSWSQCSRSCGGGTQKRLRTCDGPNDCVQPCEGENSESQACNVEECPRPPAVPSITTDPRTSPLSAGVTVTLTCSSSDLGSPPATLTWDTARQGVMTSPVYDHTTRLVISKLSAEDDGLRVKCLASNTVSPKEKSIVLRVDEKASFGECHASASSSTWEVTGYCNITKVFSSNNQYHCQWREIRGYNTINIPSSFNLSPITPGRKLQRGKCGFLRKIPRDFPEQRELSRGIKYQMYFNPGGTRSPIINVTVDSPEMPSLLIGSRTIFNYTTNVNNSVYFTCRVGPSNVQSLELLKVTRNGSQILPGLSISSPSFRIEKAGCGDSGIYYCRAGNTVGQTNSMSVQLSVLCSPEWASDTFATTTELKVTEGLEGQTTFEVMASPVPTIDGFIFHQEENNSSSQEKPVRSDLFTGKCEQKTPDLHLATCTVYVTQATPTDNGLYSVHVSNSMGAMTVTIELRVTACRDNLTECPSLTSRCGEHFVQEFCWKTCSGCRKQTSRNKMLPLVILCYTRSVATCSDLMSTRSTRHVTCVRECVRGRLWMDCCLSTVSLLASCEVLRCQ